MNRTSFPARWKIPFAGVVLAIFALGVATAPNVSAHPLGNFTTNSATHAVITPDTVEVFYVLDMAEIPALAVRQELGAASGAVPANERKGWEQQQCARSAKSLRITEGSALIGLIVKKGSLTFPSGQAGLTTLRLECRFLGRRLSIPQQFKPNQTSIVTTASVGESFTINDDNFSDRLGWREISVEGSGVVVSGNVKLRSPTLMLSQYPEGAVTAPLRDQSVSFSVSPLAEFPAEGPKDNKGASYNQPKLAGRGNDGLTDRFQALVAERNITVWFALGAMLLALALGSLHALAPGHGKTIMAAYAISRSGAKRDILAIGATVAVTHTIGVACLGLLVSATSVVSPTRTLQWASVVSGIIIFGVGVTIVRSRIAGIGHKHSHAHSRDHGHTHGHANDHSQDGFLHGLNQKRSGELDHAHVHRVEDEHSHQADHAHDHWGEHGQPPAAHSHEKGALRGREQSRPVLNLRSRWAQVFRQTSIEVRNDPRFVVSSHNHGGWSHEHVLPAPGAMVKRRELIAMGLAGGLVPSPSALVVLLGAIALGRVTFGIALVIAYGIGLALTLIAAGFLLVRFESGVRGITARMNTSTGKRMAHAMQLLPLISGFAIAGAGALLVLRSAQRF